MSEGTLLRPMATPWWVRACACALFSLLLGLSARPARAQEPPFLDSEAQYRSTLKEALAEYDASHFEEARILFRRAHEINPNARTLRSIGMASFELRDYPSAVRALSAALTETRKALSPDQRTHAEGLLERSRMFVDVYTLKISPSDARVLIDGRAPDYEPDGSLLLGFGSHNVEVSKAGYALRSLVVDVRGSERKELAVTLERKPLAAGKGAGEFGAGEPRTAKRADGQSGSWSSSTPWYIGAAGAALLAGGATGLWIFENKELTSCHNPPSGSACNNESAIKVNRNIAVGATVGAGVAAVTLGVVGYLKGRRDDAGMVTVAGLGCSLLPTGVVCGRRF